MKPLPPGLSPEPTPAQSAGPSPAPGEQPAPGVREAETQRRIRDLTTRIRRFGKPRCGTGYAHHSKPKEDDRD